MDKETQDMFAKLFNKLVDIEEKIVTKNEFQEFKVTLYGHIDGFVKLHETLDVELVALRGKYERLEERIEMIERKMALHS